MPVQKKITPTGLISSILGLAAFGSLLFGVNNHFVSKAEASDIVAAQQADRVETDLKLLELEMEFVESKLEDADTNDDDKKEHAKRLEYLKKRQTVLEQYQLELQKD